MEIKEESMYRDEFLNLTSVGAVRTFLSERGRSHERGYYHYTGVDALAGMLASRKLHLTRGDILNDRAEGVVGEERPERWGRTYVASFAFGKTESVAMWAIYGDPIATGVRLGFDRKSFVETVQNVQAQQILKVGKNNDYHQLRFSDEAGVTIEIADVVYALKKGMTWDGAKLPFDACCSSGPMNFNKSLLGLVKDFAWRYEKETRILVTLPHGMEYPDRIAIPFGKAIEAMTITRSPCVTQEQFDGLLAKKKLSHRSKASHLFMKVKLPRQCGRCSLKEENACPLFPTSHSQRATK